VHPASSELSVDFADDPVVRDFPRRQTSPHFTTATSVAASSKACPQGRGVIDMQKMIVFRSEGAERSSGRLRHEVIGRSCVSNTLLHCDPSGSEFCNEELVPSPVP
jgi:hypothetical protein